MLLSAPDAGLLCGLCFSTVFEGNKNEICGWLDICFTSNKGEIAECNAFLAEALRMYMYFIYIYMYFEFSSAFCGNRKQTLILPFRFCFKTYLFF